MKVNFEDLLALHYQAFFQFSRDSWKEIFEIEVPPFYAWEQYFGEPFESFPLSDAQRKALKGLTHFFAADCNIRPTTITAFFEKLELVDISHLKGELTSKDTLDNIHTIAAKGCNLKDKDLSHFTGCRKFTARFNDITSIENLLVGNPEIEEIILMDNSLKKIEPGTENTKLKSLNCGKNLLTDVSGLLRFRNLENLYLDNNLITNVDAILELPSLKEVSLDNNRFKGDYLDKILEQLEKKGIEVISE